MQRGTPDTLVLLSRAFAHQQAGKLAEAEADYAQVLARDPNDATALVNGGAVALARGDLATALARFERAVRRLPANAAARANLGYALIHAGRDAEALAALDDAIALAPNHAQAHNNRGIALARLRRGAEAIAAFERALALDPRNVEAAQNLGEQLNAAGDGARAAAAFERVLALQPQNATAASGRAFAQALQGDLKGAEAALAALARANPQHAPAWQTLGAVRQWAWDHAGAESAFRRALAVAPQSRDAQFGVAASLLARGDYAAGWAAFEQRPDRAAEAGAAFAALAPWDGGTWPGTLVVYGEQGFGDVIQFARFLAKARERVGRLVLLLDGYRAPLAPLLAGAAGTDAVITDPAQVPYGPDTVRISLLSLPFHLGAERTALAAARYLAPPAPQAQAWQERMAACPAPRVGLAWSVLTRDAHAFVARHKSVPPSALAPLLAHRGVSFVNLQPGAAGDPAAFGRDAARIVDVRPHLRDFAETAALLETLDLVIAPDTAVAHLAAALGKPVWMLDRFNACWRWRTDGEASPWYPSLRIFRQPWLSDWASVSARVQEAFAARYP
ncbi:MAG: tetratricopeptide repeat protein [Burkholderiales bacterium]